MSAAQRFTPIVLFDDFHPKSHPSTIPAPAPESSSPTQYQHQQQQQPHSQWPSSQKNAAPTLTDNRDDRDSGMGMDMDIDMDESRLEQPSLAPHEENSGNTRHSLDTRIPSEGVEEDSKTDLGSTSPTVAKNASRKTSISSSSTAATQVSSSNSDLSSSALVSLPSSYSSATSSSMIVFPKTSSPTTPPTASTSVSVRTQGPNTHRNSNTSTSPSMTGKVVIDMHWKRVQRMLQQNSLLWWELVRYTRDLERKEREQEVEKENTLLSGSSTESGSQTLYHQHHHHHHYYHPMLPPLHPQQQYRQADQLLSSTSSSQTQQQQPSPLGSLSTRRSVPSIRTKIMQNRSHPYEYLSLRDGERSGSGSGSGSGSTGGGTSADGVMGREERDQERSDPLHHRPSRTSSVYDRADYRNSGENMQSTAIAGSRGPMTMDMEVRTMAPGSVTPSSSPRSTSPQPLRRASISSMNEAEDHFSDQYPPQYSNRDHSRTYNEYTSRHDFAEEHALPLPHRSDTPRAGAGGSGGAHSSMSKTATFDNCRTRDAMSMNALNVKRRGVQPRPMQSRSSPSSSSPPALMPSTVDHKSLAYDQPLPSPRTSAGIQSSGPSSVASSPQSRERPVSMMQPSSHSHHYHPHSQYHSARTSSNEPVHHQWSGSGPGSSLPPRPSSPSSASKPHYPEYSHAHQHPHHHHHHHHHPHPHIHYLHPNAPSKGLSGRSHIEHSYPVPPLNGAAAPVIQRPIPVKPSSTTGPHSLSASVGGRGGLPTDSGVPEHVRSSHSHGNASIGSNGANVINNSNNTNHGSMPTSTTATLNHNSSNANNSSNNNNNSNNNGSTMDPNRKRRGNLPKSVTSVLKNWLVQNATHPYPTEEEKMQLSAATQLSMNQISNWFINARRRILQPILVEVAAAKIAAAAASTDAGSGGNGHGVNVTGGGGGGRGGVSGTGGEGLVTEKKNASSTDGINMISPENIMIVRKGKGSRMQVEGLGNEPLSASAIANVNATIAAANRSLKDMDRDSMHPRSNLPPLSTTSLVSTPPASSSERMNDESEPRSHTTASSSASTMSFSHHSTFAPPPPLPSAKALE